MVEPDGRWRVLDWDDLALGDPAEDYATLARPVVAATGGDWREPFPDIDDGPLAARVDRHLRAITLDCAIVILPRPVRLRRDWPGQEAGGRVQRRPRSGPVARGRRHRSRTDLWLALDDSP